MLARTAQPEEFDRGPKAPTGAGAADERLCAVSRSVQSTDAMIRFVRSPEGEVVPDVKRKLPGRGLWLTASKKTVEEAVRRNVFARGFKAETKTPSDLPALTDRLLEQSALDALAIAGKASLVLHGFAKVEGALAQGKAVGIIHAADGADDGKRKINAYLRNESRGLPVFEAFATAQLDLALGRSNVVHAALLAGSATDTFVARASRLARFRGLEAPPATGGAKSDTIGDPPPASEH
jgi:predicted RNA-binding protein YlxR (DUF448 family)